MNEEKDGGQLSLLDIYNVARHYKWWLLISPLVAGVLASFIVFYVLQPAWEGSAVIEMGRVGTAPTVPVELTVNVATRMMLPSFTEGVIRDAGIKPGELNAYKGALTVTKVKEADLLAVAVRAPSVEMAKNQLKSSISYLQKVHSEMMAASIDTNNKTLLNIAQNIKNTSVDIELLRKKLLVSHDWNTFDATLASSILQSKSAELRAFIQQRLVLEEQMSPTRTYTTRMVGDIYVSAEPVSPNKRLIIGLAVLLGLFGALVVVFVHNAITSQSSR
ncbi:MAG: hypothetical protein WC825_08565 [Gallionellaceae bacterium]|jgi:capsular polysaccharide biosynthesis protein